jgi:phosphate transport system protein
LSYEPHIRVTSGHTIQITLALRALERIGGHAKNIAGHLVYLATGEDVRHVDDDTVVSLAGKVS